MTDAAPSSHKAQDKLTKAGPDFFTRRWLIRRANLPTAAKLVLAVVQDYDGSGNGCIVKQDELAMDVSLKPRQLRNVMATLADVVNVERRGRGLTNRLSIDWKALASMRDYRKSFDGLSDDGRKWIADQDRQPVASQTEDDRQHIAAETGNPLPPGPAASCRPDRQPVADPINTNRTQTDNTKGNANSARATIEAELIVRWNGIPDVANVRSMTTKRRKALLARLRDDDFREGWQEALERLAASNFCRGQGKNGWLATLDWFLKPDSVNKLLEGHYDNRNGSNGVDGHAGLAAFVGKESER